MIKWVRLYGVTVNGIIQLMGSMSQTDPDQTSVKCCLIFITFNKKYIWLMGSDMFRPKVITLRGVNCTIKNVPIPISFILLYFPFFAK
jgi:hypothetical protein